MIRRLIILLLIVGCVFAREYIAIIDFEGIGVSTDDAKTLTQRLTSEMIALEAYQVLERSEMKRLLEEQKFQYSGCVDLKCAVELGKLLGAKYMVVGNISKLGSAYSIDSRLISVESGESYVSATYTLQGDIESLLIDGMKSIAHQLCELPYEEIVIESRSIKKERKKVAKEDISNFHSSFNVGVLTNKSSNALQYTRDYRIGNNNSMFIAVGFPNIGIGLCRQNNYNENGFLASIGVGIHILYERTNDITDGGKYINYSIGYQWRFKKQGFITLGAGALHYKVYDNYYDGIFGYGESSHWRSFIESVVPIISYDYRF